MNELSIEKIYRELLISGYEALLLDNLKDEELIELYNIEKLGEGK